MDYFLFFDAQNYSSELPPSKKKTQNRTFLSISVKILDTFR